MFRQSSGWEASPCSHSPSSHSCSEHNRRTSSTRGWRLQQKQLLWRTCLSPMPPLKQKHTSEGEAPANQSSQCLGNFLDAMSFFFKQCQVGSYRLQSGSGQTFPNHEVLSHTTGFALFHDYAKFHQNNVWYKATIMLVGDQYKRWIGLHSKALMLNLMFSILIYGLE